MARWLTLVDNIEYEFRLTGSGIVRISKSNGDLLYLHATQGGNGNTGSIAFKGYGGSNTDNPASKISFIDDGSYSSHIAFLTKTPGADTNGLSERVRITSSGDVGIGTNSPASKLHVSGTITANGIQGSNSSNFLINARNYSIEFRIDEDGSGSDNFLFTKGSNGSTELMRLTNTGRLGIGTNSPEEPLHVSGNVIATTVKTRAGTSSGGSIHLRLENNNSLRFGIGLLGTESTGDAGSNFAIWRYNDSGGFLGATLFIRRSDGNVGINNSNPTQTLDVSGNVKATTFIGSLQGNADTATKLATARTISLTGDVTGSTTFDGSANVSISASINNTVTSGTYTKVTVNNKGLVTAGSNLTASDLPSHTHSAGDITSGRLSASLLPTSSTANRVLAVTTADADPSYVQITSSMIADNDAFKPMQGISFSGINWNTLKTMGTYRVSSGGSGGSNNPPARYSYGLLEVLRNSSGGITQIYYPHTDDDYIYIRQTWDSTDSQWSPWRRIPRQDTSLWWNPDYGSSSTTSYKGWVQSTRIGGLLISSMVTGSHAKVDDSNTSWTDTLLGESSTVTATIYRFRLPGPFSEVYNVQLTTVVQGDNETGLRRPVQNNPTSNSVLVSNAIDVDYHVLSYFINEYSDLELWVKRVKYNNNDATLTGLHILAIGSASSSYSPHFYLGWPYAVSGNTRSISIPVGGSSSINYTYYDYGGFNSSSTTASVTLNPSISGVSISSGSSPNISAVSAGSFSRQTLSFTLQVSSSAVAGTYSTNLRFTLRGVTFDLPFTLQIY